MRRPRLRFRRRSSRRPTRRSFKIHTRYLLATRVQSQWMHHSWLWKLRSIQMKRCNATWVNRYHQWIIIRNASHPRSSHNRAIYRIFDVCDSSSLDYVKVCVNLNSMAHLIDRKRCKFIDTLMSDVRFFLICFLSGCRTLCDILLCTGLLLPFYSVLFFFSRVLHLLRNKLYKAYKSCTMKIQTRSIENMEDFVNM